MREEIGQPIRIPAGAPLRPVFATLIVTTTFAVAIILLRFASSSEARNFDPRCEHLDIAAAMRLAQLISDRNEVTHMQVRDGLIRLRRARRNCLYDGFISARRDYEAISAVRRDVRP